MIIVVRIFFTKIEIMKILIKIFSYLFAFRAVTAKHFKSRFSKTLGLR